MKNTDCDSVESSTLTLDQALARIAAAVPPMTEQETQGLHGALDRVLATDIASPIDVPGHANSAMDGYALRAADLPGTLRVIGTALAGRPYGGSVNAGEAVRIMTGAVLPASADTVVMQEHAQREGETVRIDTPPKPGANVRHPGEDMRRGEVVLTRGRRLTPADLGVLASLGIGAVPVLRRPRVAFFSTGDELRGVGEPLGEGQIYDSNRYTLFGMLTRLGVEVLDLGVIPDDRTAIAAAFRDGAARADVLLTSGGVSVGEADYVKETLQAQGQVDFWKIAMKPGKPLAFGFLGKTVFFGLPGNPVSAMATFYQVVQPTLRRLAGETQTEPLRLKLRCIERLKKRPGRQDFQRGLLLRDDNGELVVRGAGPQGSHVLTGMSRADCFIVLPRESGDVEAGSMVEVQPFAGMI